MESPASWPSEGVSSEERRGNIRRQTGVIHVKEAILVLESLAGGTEQGRLLSRASPGMRLGAWWMQTARMWIDDRAQGVEKNRK